MQVTDVILIATMIASLLPPLVNMGLHFRKRRRLWTGFWAPLAASAVLTFALVFGAGLLSNDGWGWLIRDIWEQQVAVLFFLICTGYVVLTGLFVPARVACPHCQAVNRYDAQYCWQCGQALALSAVPENRSPLLRLIAWYRGRRWMTRSAVTLGTAFISGFLFMLLIAAMVGVTQSGSLRESSTEIGENPTMTPAMLPPPATPYEYVEVMIAYQPIPRGTIIDGSMIGTIAFPYSSAPLTSLSDYDDVVGRVARTDIHSKEIILQSQLTDDIGSLARVSAPLSHGITFSGSVLHPSRPLDDEISDAAWGYWYAYSGNAGQAITFVMETTGGTLKPFLMVWRWDRLVWIEGQRSQSSDGRKTALTVTLDDGYYTVMATRARLNNGRTSGTFHLSAVEGYVTLP